MTLHESPLRRTRRFGLIALAFLGSLFFGSSLASAVGTESLGSAVWLTACAGLGWAALIPGLRWATELPYLVLLDICLLTIAVGEAVLITGGLGILSGFWTGVIAAATIVGVSNVAMASTLCLLMRKEGIPVWKTLTAWMLLLNGIGGLCFWILGFMVEWGGR